MSRNRNKKRLYRMALATGENGTPTATLEVEDEDGDVEGFERALGKGADIVADDQPSDSILFIPITKVDATAREVWGRAAQEVRDHADEIMDYQSSKPLFAAWVEDTLKRSQGKSKGNIRAMHGPIAAGKVTDFQFNDGEKAFDIGTKIIDEQEWQKCLEGVYTGFSIGGKYARRWYDNGLTRYTAQPREISLVDAPAIPTATFKLVKEDGTEELHKFAKYLDGDLDKALPTAPTPTRQTYVDTQVMVEPALNVPLQVTQADQENANLDSAKFIEAQNPQAGAIDALTIAAPVIDLDNPDTTSTGPAIDDLIGQGKTTKADDAPDFEKAVQHIPGLRHIDNTEPAPGVYDMRSCASCLQVRCMDETWYCRKFDSVVRSDWVCDDWEKATGDADAKFIPLAETAEPAPVEMAKPTDDNDAAKADKPKEDDPEETKLKAVGERVGIARRDGSPKTPPKNYPADLAQYADPANYAFPCDKPRAVTAVGYYNAGGEKLKAYNPRERAVLGRRIARLAGAATGASYRFDPKEKQIKRTDKEQGKMDKNVSDMLVQARSLMSAGTPEALEQASAIMDVAIDTVSTPSAINPQTTAIATSVPTAAKEDGPKPSSSEEEAAEGETKSPEPAVPTTGSKPPFPPAKKAEKVEKMEEVSMADNVYSSNPPQPFNVGVGGESYVKGRMNDFVSIMANGSDMNRLQKAFKTVAEGDQGAFTDLWNFSCYELAKQAGFNYQNAHNGQLPGRTTFGAGISGYGREVELAKAFNGSTAPGIYLQRLLALMLPVMNPWRQRVSTTSPTDGSDQAIWRAILGFQSTVLAMGMAQAEAGTTIGSTTGNGVPINETPVSFTAPYQSIKTNGVVTYKSLYTMRGYDDPVAVQLLMSLTAALKIEEYQNLLGNYALVAPTSAVTVTPSTAAGAVPASNYIVRVTSLTGLGWRLTQEIPTYIGGGTYTINGASTGTVGESAPRSSTPATTLGATGQLICTWPSVPGALAYNVYVRDDTGNTEHYYATVTAPKVTITAYPSTGNAGVSITDSTANTLGFNGVAAWSVLSTVYGTTIPQKSNVVVDAAGSALTLVAPNNISQLDTVIGGIYKTWQMAPSLLLMSPDTTTHLTGKVGSATNPPQLIVIQQGPAQGQVIGGLSAVGYVNRFSPWLSGAPAVIPILAHPYFPDGFISVLCENIPYPNARRSRAWELSTLRPYTYVPLGNLTDQIPFEIAADEVLQNHHPSSQGAVYGIDIS